MIVFCEDCGGKNHIHQSQFEAGRVIFQCTHCSYNNNYLLSSTHPTDGGIKNGYLKEILSYPDTLGGFVYHMKKGVQINEMPASFSIESINNLGNALSQNLLACLSNISESKHMTVYMSKRNMVVQYIDSKHVMVVMCESKKTVKKVEDYLENAFDTSAFTQD